VFLKILTQYAASRFYSRQPEYSRELRTWSCKRSKDIRDDIGRQKESLITNCPRMSFRLLTRTLVALQPDNLINGIRFEKLVRETLY
jgi:hypothetical protein